MILLALLIVASLPAIDSLFRLLLLVASRRPVSHRDPAKIASALVVVPARDEGEHVRATLQSVKQAGGKGLLVLDGADPVAERVARELGADVVVKQPPGPTKAAALAWLVANHRDRLLASEAVLLLDVGSTLSPDFFSALEWPRDAAALQARLRGAGQGVGVAVAASEADAQMREDRGREAFGWSARLRGTGSLFQPAAFVDVTPNLRTRIEDLEATLLLIARGERVVLGGPDAFVVDDKPATVYSAASQRSRWLLGRYEVLFKRGGAMARALIRKPLETIALFFEIFGRPLSLTIPFRVVVSIVAIAKGWLFAWAIMATAILDIILTFASGRASVMGAARLALAWALAVFMAPRALFRWMRAKRS